MEFINGSLRILYIKIDGVYLPIACLTSNSFTESVQMLDTTVRTNRNGWSSSVPTIQKYSISFSGLITNDIASDVKATYRAIENIKRQRQLLDWKIDDGNGNPYYGQSYITNLSNDSNIDEFVSFSGSLVGQGEPSSDLDNIYFGYKDRVEAAGETLSSEKCTREYVESLIL